MKSASRSQQFYTELPSTNGESDSAAITHQMTDSNLHQFREEARFVKGIFKDP
jgi:hypothetical protein